jgi:hypothetical protein
MKKEAMELWVKGLRSGLLTQGKCSLLSIEGDFCCLGVACYMTGRVPEKVQVGYAFEGATQFIPPSIRNELGMFSPGGHRRDLMPIALGETRYNNLAGANDAGCTFAQIADYIEANWEAL